MEITENQILQLSPDASSTKAGKKLATPAKWVERAAHAKALWGACQGSGKNPYTTMVDTVNIAFKCSCPSRKFPCKHALGLLFLYAQSPTEFQQASELADHVATWIGKRENKAEAKATKPKKPVDEKARQKRIAKRQEKVDAGVAELNLWLKDLVRTGIMNIPQQAYQFTNKIAARMVDAQAPGLANRVKGFSQINFYEEGWQQELLRKVAITYLLTTAYQNQPQQSEDWQHEIKSQIGWSVSKEEVQTNPIITDEWLVLSRTIEPIDQLRMEKIWLYGKQQQQFGLLLNFFAKQQVVQEVYLVGSVIQASMHYYPGVHPQRVLLKEQNGTSAFFRPTGLDSLDELYESVANSLATNPFITSLPFLLDKVHLRYVEELWYIQDQKGYSIPIQNNSEQAWQMMAASLGQPVMAFVNYSSRGVSILSLIKEEVLVGF